MSDIEYIKKKLKSINVDPAEVISLVNAIKTKSFCFDEMKEARLKKGLEND